MICPRTNKAAVVYRELVNTSTLNQESCISGLIIGCSNPEMYLDGLNICEDYPACREI